MPTVADRKRGQAIREYFRDKWLGHVTKAREVREAVIAKFNLPPRQWYYFQNLLDADIREYNKSHKAVASPEIPSEVVTNDQQEVLDLTIPHNASESVKASFAKMVTEIVQLREAETTIKAALTQSSLSLVREQQRNKVLKKLLETALEAL